MHDVLSVPMLQIPGTKKCHLNMNQTFISQVERDESIQIVQNAFHAGTYDRLVRVEME
jgi:hypothetical protein